MPRCTSARNSCQARLKCDFFARSLSCESRISRCIARQPSPRRLSTFSSMPWLTWKRDVSRSGEAPISRLKVARSQFAKLCSGGLLLTTLLAVLRLLAEPQVVDHVLGGLRHHPAEVVEALASRPAGDLVEVARREHRRLLPVELAQPREEHGADRHVDADPERVGAADDLEQPLLRELLDEHAVLRQQPRVVQADALLQPLAHVRPVRAREAEAGDLGRDRVLFLARAQVEAREVLRAVGRVLLREVDDVDRRLLLGHELLDRLGERDLGVRVLERHRPLAGLHDRRRPPACGASAPPRRRSRRRASPTSAGSAPAAASAAAPARRRRGRGRRTSGTRPSPRRRPTPPRPRAARCSPGSPPCSTAPARRGSRSRRPSRARRSRGRARGRGPSTSR